MCMLKKREMSRNIYKEMDIPFRSVFFSCVTRALVIYLYPTMTCRMELRTDILHFGFVTLMPFLYLVIHFIHTHVRTELSNYFTPLSA